MHFVSYCIRFPLSFLSLYLLSINRKYFEIVGRRAPARLISYLSTIYIAEVEFGKSFNINRVESSVLYFTSFVTIVGVRHMDIEYSSVTPSSSIK